MGYRPGRGVGARRQSESASGLALLFLVFPLVAVAAVAWSAGLLDFGLWWATNTAPPIVQSASPVAPLRGSFTLFFDVQPAGRAAIIEAQIDGRSILAPTANLEIDTAGLTDGDHTVAVVAEDFSFQRNRAVGRAAFRSDNTPPRVTIEAFPNQAAAGHGWLLRLRTDEPATVHVRLGDHPLELQLGDGFGWVIVGFPPTAEPTTLALTVEATDRLGNRAERQSSVTLASPSFPIDRVEAPPNLAPLLGPETRAEEDRRLAPTYARMTQPRLWEGKFLQPVQGEVITQFGTLRSYNGGPIVGNHAGVDLAAPMGRLVVAANRGRIALVDTVQLRGKMIVIDHGLGLFTTYAHLSAVDVQVGQLVEGGQPIGKVGSTGLSTGPHLHWELWIAGANVDPMDWVQRDIP